MRGPVEEVQRKPARPPENTASADDGPPRPDRLETYSRMFERFPSVPEGYVVEHLSWDEYKDSGLPDADLVVDLDEVMSAKDLQKVWFDVLRDPDGNIVAERDQSGGRWWTRAELAAKKQADWEYEGQMFS